MARHGAHPHVQIMEYGRRLSSTRGLAFFVCVLSAVLLCGCSSSPQSPSPSSSIGNQGATSLQAHLRLIIKFKSSAVDPASPDVMNRLSHEAGVRLVHIRPMFGGAHVIGTESAVEPSLKAEILRKLAGMDGVEYVEEDAIMQPMQGR